MKFPWPEFRWPKGQPWYYYIGYSLEALFSVAWWPFEIVLVALMWVIGSFLAVVKRFILRDVEPSEIASALHVVIIVLLGPAGVVLALIGPDSAIASQLRDLLLFGLIIYLWLSAAVPLAKGASL